MTDITVGHDAPDTNRQGSASSGQEPYSSDSHGGPSPQLHDCARRRECVIFAVAAYLKEGLTGPDLTGETGGPSTCL